MRREQAIRARSWEVSERVRGRSQKCVLVEVSDRPRIEGVTGAVLSIDAHRSVERGIVARDAGTSDARQITRRRRESERRARGHGGNSRDSPIADEKFDHSVSAAQAV